MNMLPSVLLVGCGNMGGALWNGWLREGLAPSVVVDRHLESVPTPHRLVRKAEDIPADFHPHFIVLAVKPAGMETTIAALAPWLPGSLLVSMLAGRTGASLKAACEKAGKVIPVIRAMPNTPSAIGKGVTGAFSEDIDDSQRTECTHLLAAVGKVAWVENEEQLVALTTISGCGPAYVFLLAELLEREGQRHGLSHELARMLARETIAGSGALLAMSPEESATLRKNVTSPNGVTAKALEVLMAADAWPQTLERAIDQAAQRARELAV
ncbi:pyrroline-5-carboxylate reductase [Kozakia baliensis]|uniref:pyrroline-5-carboxylate reductase n=1 Tax=Kozakia baliensis TaxID=153496 RepID=UPI00087BA31E|nr:pyrroline-5-carboxylate reductase [Kozakia baliensis]AOX20689.1 pyrroline-5-carboxylate reductase [Kozakia baliensis]